MGKGTDFDRYTEEHPLEEDGRTTHPELRLRPDADFGDATAIKPVDVLARLRTENIRSIGLRSTPDGEYEAVIVPAARYSELVAAQLAHDRQGFTRGANGQMEPIALADADVEPIDPSESWTPFRG